MMRPAGIDIGSAATYVFSIPSDLAYGKTGRGTIPGNAALVFEIQLIKVVRK